MVKKKNVSRRRAGDARDWLKIEPGALHRQLGMDPDRKIPVETLEQLKRSKSTRTRRRATLALNARKRKHAAGPESGRAAENAHTAEPKPTANRKRTRRRMSRLEQSVAESLGAAK